MILIAISSLAFYAINNSSNKFTDYREMAIDSNIAKNLLNELMILRITAKNFIQNSDEKSKKTFFKKMKDDELLIAEAEKAIQNPERVRLLKEVKDLFSRYKASFTSLVEVTDSNSKFENKFQDNHKNILKDLNKIRYQSREEKFRTQYHYWVFFGKLKEAKDQGLELPKKAVSSFKKNLFSIRSSDRTNLRILEEDFRSLIKSSEEIIKGKKLSKKIVLNELDKMGPQIAVNLQKISSSIQEVQDTLGPELVKINEMSQNTVAIASVFGLVLALISVFVVMRNLSDISSKILSLSSDLNKNTLEINSISQKTAESSKKVSDSSHEQAASLEQTSSSLEEMDGMTRKNLDSVKNANDLTAKMKEISEKADTQMNDLVLSMKAITESNQKIEELSSVISEIERKTRLIDEIVSQTKILSFNASVEAERAGEHGKGFAVVAEEVGSLAKTSGDAAKEIQDIVVSSLKSVDLIISTNREKVENGNRITSEATKILKDINTSCGNVLLKNEEVLNATNEQALGIKQINISVSELDRSTQENSSIAQETTVVAKNLEVNSSGLSQIVKNLNNLLGVEEKDHENIEVEKDEGKVVNLQGLKKSREKEKKDNANMNKITDFEPQKIASNDPWDTL